MTARQRSKSTRDPQATREAILSAARGLISQDGPEAVSVVRVANLAGVNRGTAYQHFQDRHQLIRAAVETVGMKLLEAVELPADRAASHDHPFADPVLDVQALRLAEFVSENAELCRVWLFEMLSTSDPANDTFARNWVEKVQAFGRSGQANEGLDVEVFAVIALAGYLIWPIWSHAATLGARARKANAQRFVTEFLRLGLHGSMNLEFFPRTAALVERNLAGARGPARKAEGAKPARASDASGPGQAI